MSNAQHTPGPWNKVTNSSGRTYRVEGCGETVASFPIMGTSIDVQENEANARLIAAAPELLQAITQIINDLPQRRDWLDPALEQYARAAIAKAKGE